MHIDIDIHIHTHIHTYMTLLRDPAVLKDATARPGRPQGQSQPDATTYTYTHI